MSNTRQAFVEVIYQGVNITREIAEDTISIKYTDEENGKADKIKLTLKDENSKWLTNWRPRKGDEIGLRMFTTNWRNEGDAQELNCGVFVVDRIKHSGPPTVVSVEATSTDSLGPFRSRTKNRTWEDIPLKQLAEEIAAANGYELYFDSRENPIITRSEQMGESDARYLAKQAAKYGYGMKVNNVKIILYKIEDLDNRIGVSVIDKTDCTAWELENSATNFIEEVVVAYYDPKTNTTRKAGFIGPLQPDSGNLNEDIPPTEEGGPQQSFAPEFIPLPLRNLKPVDIVILSELKRGRTPEILTDEPIPVDRFGSFGPATPKSMIINVPFYNVEEGELIAKSEFIKRNKGETIIEFKGLPLNLDLVVGVNAYVTGFSTYTGKYSVEKASHSIGNSSKTDVTLKRTVVT